MRSSHRGVRFVPVTRSRVKGAVSSGERWAGYGWFMTLGTILPLVIFLAGYLVHITLVGAPIARRCYRFGIWTSTMGQEPPGKDKFEARARARRGSRSSSASGPTRPRGCWSGAVGRCR